MADENNPDASAPADQTQNQPAAPMPPTTPAPTETPAPVTPAATDMTATPSPTPTVTPAATVGGQPAGMAPKKKMGSKMLAMLLVLLVVLAGAGYGGYTLFKPKPKPVPNVKIGVMLAFSGGSSSMGYGAMKGIQLAKQQLNASNITLVTADGQCNPDVAPNAYKYLVSQHVAAVIGENCSSASVAVLPLANTDKIPLISPSASSPLLSIPNDYFFRTVPSDDGQGNFLAKSMYKAGIRHAAVFFTDEPYGSAIQQVFTQEFKSLGGTVVASVSAPSSNINVATQAAAIKAANPDGLAIVTNSTVSSSAIMQKVRADGMAAPMYGGDNLYDNTIITDNGAVAEGLHVVTFPTGSAAFKQALFNQYHVNDQLYAAPEAYDAFKTVYLAVQAGATTGPEIKAELAKIKFQGASSYIQFDNNGELPYQTYTYALLEVKNGAFVLLN